MSRTKGRDIGKAIARAQRTGKGRGKPEENRAAERSSISTVTLHADGRSVKLTPLAERDWPISIIGLELLEKAVKSFRKAATAVALDPELVARREAECSALLEGLKADSPALKLGINVEWITTLRAGLALEFDQTRKLAETQGELRLDPEETEDRIRQLDRLMSDLDVAKMAG